MRRQAYLLAPGGAEFTVLVGQLAGIGQDSRVLEIGCGMGQSSALIAQRFGCAVEAYDLSPDCIARAQAHARQQGVQGRICFHCADIRNAGLASGRYDLALAEGGVLTAVRQREAILRQLIASLKPGGFLALSDLVLHPWAAKAVAAYYAPLAPASEPLYRQLLHGLGCEITLACLLPASAWRRYFLEIGRALRAQAGFLKDAQAAAKVRDEAALYYRQGGREAVDYLLIVAHKGQLKAQGHGV